jgi:hypothetical protein
MTRECVKCRWFSSTCSRRHRRSPFTDAPRLQGVRRHSPMTVTETSRLLVIRAENILATPLASFEGSGWAGMRRLAEGLHGGGWKVTSFAPRDLGCVFSKRGGGGQCAEWSLVIPSE